MRRLILFLLPVALLCTSARAQRQEYERQWHYVTTDYETPHTKWASPLSGGKLRMLLIAPRPCQRDTAELAQRLDLDYEVLCTYTHNHLGWYESDSPTRIVKFSPADRERDLRERLARRPAVITIFAQKIG